MTISIWRILVNRYNPPGWSIVDVTFVADGSEYFGAINMGGKIPS